jgi:hypothetical protein
MAREYAKCKNRGQIGMLIYVAWPHVPKADIYQG